MQFRPAAEVLPPELFKALSAMGKKGRGGQKAPTKRITTIRLSAQTIDTFKATGAGWQSRINAALEDWLKTHAPNELNPSSWLHLTLLQFLNIWELLFYAKKGPYCATPCLTIG